MPEMLRPTMDMARSRIGGLIAIGCAVAGGAAMVAATAVIGESGLRSHPPVDRLAAADLTVSAPQYIVQDEEIDLALPERAMVDGDLVDTIAQLPGVSTAVGDIAFPAALLDADGAPVPSDDGHGWSLATVGNPPVDGAQPQGDNQIALDTDTARAAGVAAGDTVTVSLAGAAQDVEVTGLVDAPGTGLYVDDATAAALAGRTDGPRAGTVDLIAITVDSGVEPEKVAERVSAAVGGDWEVTTGDDIGEVEAPGSGTGELVAMAASLAGTIIMIVGFIVAGAVSVSAAGQRRELALLRAVGATPKQVRRLIATQASVAAAIGVLPGTALGYLLADRFGDLLVSTGLLSATTPLSWSPFPAVIAVAGMLAAVQIAARAAARRVSRISPTEAITESTVEPREPSKVRVRIGFPLMGMAVAASTAPLFVHNEAAFVSAASSILLAMVGLALAAPAVVRGFTGRLARTMSHRVSAPTWLAVANSHGYALRMAGAVTVLALAVGFTITQVFSQTTMTAAIDDELAAGSLVDSTVTGETGVTETDRRELAEADGVDAAVGLTRTVMFAPYREDGKARATDYPALAVTGPVASVLDPDVESGSLDDLTGDTIAMDASAAWFEDVEVGDTVHLRLGDGTAVKPTVVATYSRGFGFGKIIASSDLLTTATGPRPYDAVLLSGTDSGTMSSALADRPGLAVSDGGAAAGLGTGTALDANQWINLVVSLALLGYVLLGVGNSLVASTTRRRGELATLRLIGATSGQLAAMMRREAALMTGMAVGMAFVLSVIPMSLMGLGFVGLPWPQGPLWVIPAIAALVCGIAYLATLLPTRRLLAEPVTAAARAD